MEIIGKCNDCGKAITDAETSHVLYPDTTKKYCSDCFNKELEKTRKKWMKEHPCPFKYKWWKGMEEPVDIIACKLMNPQDECVGEKICPIYNGGMNVR